MSYHDYRTEAEQACVALAIREPGIAVTEILPHVSPDDFQDTALGEVFEVIQDLQASGTRIELNIVFQALEKRGTIDDIGRHALREMVKKRHALHNARQYTEEVRRLADHRRVIEAARRVLQSEETIDVDPEKLRDTFIAGSTVRGPAENARSIGTLVESTLEQHQEANEAGQSIAMRTGFEILDEATTGLHRGQLWLIGARTNVGKTALALSLCNNLASGATGTKRGVVFFSMEMKGEELAERVLSSEHSIPYRDLCHARTTDMQRETIKASVEEFNEWTFKVSDRPSQTVSQMTAKAKLFAPKSGLDVVVIDTLQQVKPAQRRDHRRLELQEIANDLKQMALELDCAVIVCTQLNADAENREPNLTHLSEGKQIIEPVDICLLLHRPSLDSHKMLVKLAKARRGEKRAFHLNFNGNLQRFTDPDQ